MLSTRGWRSNLTIEYDTHEVKIYSNSVKLDRNGKPKKHAIPENRVKFIKQEVSKQLGMTAYAL